MMRRNAILRRSYPFDELMMTIRISQKKETQLIMSTQYSIPDYVRVSTCSRHLLSRIFVTNPFQIKQHPSFLRNLLNELIDVEKQSGGINQEPDQRQQLQTLKT